MWNSINRGWFQQVWWMKSWMMSFCVPVIVKLPGVVRNTYRKRPTLRVSSSDTTPIDVAIVLLSYHCARALSLQYTFYTSSRSMSLRVSYRASLHSTSETLSLQWIHQAVFYIRHTCYVALPSGTLPHILALKVRLVHRFLLCPKPPIPSTKAYRDAGALPSGDFVCVLKVVKID
jgi:hypothetical protein